MAAIYLEFLCGRVCCKALVRIEPWWRHCLRKAADQVQFTAHPLSPNNRSQVCGCHRNDSWRCVAVCFAVSHRYGDECGFTTVRVHALELWFAGLVLIYYVSVALPKPRPCAVRFRSEAHHPRSCPTQPGLRMQRSGRQMQIISADLVSILCLLRGDHLQHVCMRRAANACFGHCL